MIAATKPDIDWVAALPLLILLGAAPLVLLAGLFKARVIRQGVVPALSAAAFVTAGVLGATQWGDNAELFVAAGSQGAMVFDELAIFILVIVSLAGMVTVGLSLRSRAPQEAEHGEFYALLLASASGMVVLASAQNLISMFVGLELLSIPLYVLCAVEFHRRGSLEAGLKYLIVGSLGSATFLFGLALLYGASGDTDLRGLANVDPADSLLLAGIALSIVGLAFKASVAPFHQWTPDVYEGAPTPITAFMAVATKAATFGVFLRLLDVGLIDAQQTWAPILAALAVTTIIVGNVGALGQDSLKRMLAWSSVAQAGYLLTGVVVGSKFGVEATLFYLAGYAVMNLAAFAVIIARERETDLGDGIDSMAGLGGHRPALAWPMTLAMLGLAGMPATVGFIGKFVLIGAAADGGYTWLGIAIVLGSVVSLAYYLRVVAIIWTPAKQSEAVGTAGVETTVLAVLLGIGILVLGIVPGWALRLAEEAGRSLGVL
jgi:NADH-quinone oxidoreductase subunit N